MWWVVVAILLLSAPVAAFDDWDRTDYALLSATTAAQIIDWRQTRRIAENPHRYKELNPVIGEHPDVRRVDAYFAAGWLFTAGVAYVLPANYRKLWLGGIIVISAGCVLNNANVGLGMRW